MISGPIPAASPIVIPIIGLFAVRGSACSVRNGFGLDLDLCANHFFLLYLAVQSSQIGNETSLRESKPIVVRFLELWSKPRGGGICVAVHHRWRG